MHTFDSGHPFALTMGYGVDVLITQVVPFVAVIVGLFSCILVLNCCSRRLRVNSFSAFLCLALMFASMQVLFTYSPNTTAVIFQNKLQKFYDYKITMAGKLSAMVTLLGDISNDPFVNITCTIINCSASQGFKDTLDGVINSAVLPGLNSARQQIDTLFSQTQVDSWSSLIRNYAFYVQLGVYLMVTVLFLTFFFLTASMTRTTKCKSATSIGCGFFCLFLALAMYAAVVVLSDFCLDPFSALDAIIQDDDLAFYFHCTPGMRAYPPSFGTVDKYIQNDEGIAETFYDIGCIGTTLFCGCECNATQVNRLTTMIGKSDSSTGLYGVFGCRHPKNLLLDATESVCDLVPDLIKYLFVFLTMAFNFVIHPLLLRI